MRCETTLAISLVAMVVAVGCAIWTHRMRKSLNRRLDRLAGS